MTTPAFDINIYNALATSNPPQAAAYLASFQAAQQQAAAQAQPQGYSNPSAVQAPAQLANGTLEDFYNQPTGGGGPSVTSKFFNKRPQGSWLQMSVIRDVTNSDVRQQTTPQGVPQTFKDGKPKFVLIVKVMVTGSSDGTHVTEFPDGEASIWVKGVLADELRRAMTAAGDPSGYPKADAQIVMQSAGEQASRTPGFNATKLYKLQYGAPAASALPPTVPDALPAAPVTSPAVPSPAVLNVAPTPAPTASPATVAPPAPAPTVTAEVPTVTGQQATVPEVPGIANGMPAPAVFQPPADVPVPAPVIADDKAALLARLQGQG
jgi:hypothetical protein